MPLAPVPLPVPVDVRKILTSSTVPLRTSTAEPMTVEALLRPAPPLMRTGAQMKRAEMMEKAIDQAQSSAAQIHVPLETERVIGLYFSASWCPPCRNFTPQLASTYSALKKADRDFEVVLCSWDNKPEEYLQYANQMPWVRLPFRDPRIQELSKAYNVKGIPTLVMIRASDGGLITTDARTAVPYDALGKKYPWHGQANSTLGTIWSGMSWYGKIGVVGIGMYVMYQMFVATGGRSMLRR